MRRRYRSGIVRFPFLPEAYFGFTDTESNAKLPLLHAESVSRPFQLILLHLHAPFRGLIVGELTGRKAQNGPETALTGPGVGKAFGVRWDNPVCRIRRAE